MKLTISNIFMTYPNGVETLKSDSPIIPSGIYGFLGPNGAFKFTLLRILTRVQEPDKGSEHPGYIEVLNQKEEVV